MEDQIKRLEAVCTRLESLAKGKKGGDSGDSNEPSDAYLDFETCLNDEGKALIEAMKAINNGPKKKTPFPFDKCDLEGHMNKVFDNMKSFLRLDNVCRKPEVADSQAFLSDVSAAAKYVDGNQFFKKPFRDYSSLLKGLREFFQGFLSYTLEAKMMPMAMLKGQWDDATIFNLHRFQKDATTDENKAFVKALKAFTARQKEIFKEHYKQGISWTGNKPFGADALKSAGDASAAAKPCDSKKEDKKAEETVKTDKGAGQKAANEMFNALNKGLNATSGLKKVKKKPKE